MPEGDVNEVRLYCTCGQKMRVSESMYGLPGKCVACRQKIRIPRRDEIPDGVAEIYLKDHPEFFRKVKRGPMDLAVEIPEEEAAPEALEPPEEEEGPTLPLDVLELLRVLCSLEDKVGRQLDALDRYEGAHAAEGAGRGRSELRHYQERIREARNELDEELRQRLTEVSIELGAVHEKIAQAGLAVRMGETPFKSFEENVERLRRRRERLERRAANLRGWLEVHDPHFAGGFVDVPFDQIPKPGFAVSLPTEPERKEALVNVYLEALRVALVRGERARQKLAETERLESERTMPAEELARVHDHYEAAIQLAEMAEKFYRKRLQQLRTDYEGDLLAIDAQFELARSRMHTGEIDRGRLEHIERNLTRAKVDRAKAVDLATRALAARTPVELPHARGTFLARLARPDRDRGLGADSWIAWGAALAMVIAVFLPVARHLSFVSAWSAYAGAGFFLFGPILTALALAAIGFWPQRSIRGLAIAALWLVATIVGSWTAHRMAFTATPFAERLREASILSSPGTLLLVFANVGMLAAFCVALWPIKPLRPAIPAAIVAGAICLGAVATDFGGYFLPKPYVAVLESHQQESADSDFRNKTIVVGNRGRRELYLVPSASNLRNAFLYVLERQVGSDSWQPIEGAAGFDRTRTTASAVGPILAAIGPGSSTEFSVRLPTGRYRVLLRCDSLGLEMVEPFSVSPAPGAAEPMPDISSEPVMTEDASPEQQAGDQQPERRYGRAGIQEIELVGIVAGAGRNPRFAFRLYNADGTWKRRDVSLGEVLYDIWNVAEYNPEHQTVTVSDGDQLIIVRRGERTGLG